MTSARASTRGVTFACVAVVAGAIACGDRWPGLDDPRWCEPVQPDVRPEDRLEDPSSTSTRATGEATQDDGVSDPGSTPPRTDDSRAPVLVIDEPLVFCGHVAEDGYLDWSTGVSRTLTLLPGRHVLPAPLERQRGDVDEMPRVPQASIPLQVRVSAANLDTLQGSSPMGVLTTTGFWVSTIGGRIGEGSDFLGIDGRLPLIGSEGGEWELRLSLAVPDWNPEFDREVYLRPGLAGAIGLLELDLSCVSPDKDGRRCGGPGAPQPNIGYALHDCSFPELDVRTWRVEYAKGSLELHTQTKPSTALGQWTRVVLRAEGTHDGTAWRREGPFGISRVACPTCSADDRPTVSVLFPKAIGDACGVSLEHYVHTFDCDFRVLDRWRYEPKEGEPIRVSFEDRRFDDTCRR